jgi:hypothetical protein
MISLCIAAGPDCGYRWESNVSNFSDRTKVLGAEVKDQMIETAKRRG